MIWFALRTLLGLAVAFVVAALAIFAALDLLPGDPARFILGIGATPESLAALQAELGSGLPFWQRFLFWLGGMLTGNLGNSVSLGQPVGALIAGRLAVTLPLTVLALVLALVIGLPIGFAAARRQGSLIDKGLSALIHLGIAAPNFWLGMLLVLLFSMTLRWLPQGGFIPWIDNPAGALNSLLLPALALALPLAAVLAATIRLALGDAQRSAYIRAARARGLTGNEAVWQHGLRNALLPVIALLGIESVMLLSGTLIVENVFYLPGLGRLIFDAVATRDLVLLRSSLAVLMLVVMAALFLADLLRGWADPRLTARVPA